MTHRDSPLVTIAIPTYNRADGMLPKALESAVAQTYEPLEILVADNCSPDETPALMTKYADDSRVRYVRHDTSLGAHGNFNFCVEAARGKFFLMLHDDDLIDADMIETCLSALERMEGVGYIRTGNRVIDEHGDVVDTYPNRAVGSSGADAVLNWMRFRNYWAFSSTLYETAALRAVGGFSEDKFPLTCDCYATASIALRMGGVEIQPVKASFRVHTGELTNQYSARQWVDEWHQLYLRLLELAPSADVRRQFRKEGAEFFSWLAYKHAGGVSAPFPRYATMAYVYMKFGGRHLPPAIRKKLRALKNQVYGKKQAYLTSA